ncbi:alpha/beta hydrolase fold domain-containing protein [Streptomyces sp. NRRL S-495]|uniref:alpha/beta hydrolase n=1 Tax=Streptomyces sp. NRRL S-495 TaxID=1609133 RepID=UPI0005F9007D|nr:alpha/beta hydrolase fold domain-containing protein [Streptomyces sp. NRRL S-495]KJY30556.1 hypothetical protein VR45_27345 [Streptomyces sp. NRRL S-495]
MPRDPSLQKLLDTMPAIDFDTVPLEELRRANIATVQGDAIRDEGIRYAQLLRAAGIPVEHRNHEDLVHAFCTLAPQVPAAARALDDSLAAHSTGLA